MNKLKKYSFFILVFLCGFMEAQSKSDSLSILSFVDKIHLKANIDSRIESFDINFQSDRLRVLTNNDHKLFLSVDYEFLGFSIGFTPKFLPGNNDESRKGNSSSTEYQFRFFLGNWVQRVEYSIVEGFYVENTEDFIMGWNPSTDPFLLLPSLSSRTYSGSTAYILNPKFSLRNVVYNTEWQLKSAGSFIPSFKYSYNTISFDSNNEKITEDNFNLRLASDYYYTWVVKRNWFITSYLSPSFGIRISKNTDNQSTERANYTPFGLSGGLQLGYSSNRFIFGANFEFDSIFYHEDNQTEVVNDWAYGKLYFGIRLDPPKAFTSIF